MFVLNVSGSISSNKLTTLRALNFVGDSANRLENGPDEGHTGFDDTSADNACHIWFDCS